MAFARQHLEVLASHHLVATGTTGKRIIEATGLAVECLLSGPVGGDAQIAARVVMGKMAGVIFLIAPLFAQPRQRPHPQGDGACDSSSHLWADHNRLIDRSP